MKYTKTLRLKREALTGLAGDELVLIGGGEPVDDVIRLVSGAAEVSNGGPTACATYTCPSDACTQYCLRSIRVCY